MFKKVKKAVTTTRAVDRLVEEKLYEMIAE